MKNLKFLGIFTFCLLFLGLVGPSVKAQTQQGLKPETKQHRETISRTIYITANGSWATQPTGVTFTTAIVTCNAYVYSTECVKCPSGGSCSCTYIPPVPPTSSATECGYAPYPNTPPVTPP